MPKECEMFFSWLNIKQNFLKEIKKNAWQHSKSVLYLSHKKRKGENKKCITGLLLKMATASAWRASASRKWALKSPSMASLLRRSWLQESSSDDSFFLSILVKNFTNFLKKTIDRPAYLCYTIIRKREIHKSKPRTAMLKDC